MKFKQHILSACILLLLALWIPVTLDKFWDLEGFHPTLLRQPFPDRWADVLYLLLPILEFLCVILLARGSIHRTRTSKLKTAQHLIAGFALSSVLMLGFTLFILFGVLGWYERRPCGCGSVITGLSWEQHLWFNLVFLLISVVGWWLAIRFPRRFAPFPGRPVDQQLIPLYTLDSMGAVSRSDARDHIR